MNDKAERARRLVARLREALAAGKSQRQAARKVRRPQATISRLVRRHGVRATRQPNAALPVPVKRKLKREITKGIRRTQAIADLVGVHRVTVWRWRRRMHGGPVKVAPYVCPNGHRVVYRPCTICPAVEAKRVGSLKPASRESVQRRAGESVQPR